MLDNGKWKCPNCGVENDLENAFCEECGTKRPEIGIAMAAERVVQKEPEPEPEPEIESVEDVLDEEPKKKSNKWIIFALIILAVIGGIIFVIFSNDAQAMIKQFIGQTSNSGRISASEWKKQVSALPIGGTFVFGSYEQDGDTSNGKEQLEWIVIAKQDKFVTLISKQCLDAQKYNENRSAVSWETSSLKSWLNDYFLSTAFSNDEKERISGLNADKVSILNHEEAELYFKGDASRRCNPTKYATDRGVFKSNNNTSVWWLSTPVFGARAMYIGLWGNIATDGEYVNVTNHSVRPVIRLNF